MEAEGVEALPVLDKQGGFLGAITRPSLVEALLRRERELLAESRRLQEQLQAEQQRLAARSKRFEELLRTTENRLKHLVSSTPAVICTCEPAPPYGATFISKNVKRLLGYDPRGFVEDPRFWADHIHPEDAPGIFTNLSQLFNHDQHIHEYRFRHQDGTCRWMRDELKLVRDAQGRPLEIVGYWSDITDRKRAEEALLARTFQIEAVRAVSAEIARELDLPALLRLIVRRAMELVGAASGAVYFWDLDAQEAERRFIARELHDQIGQALTAVKMSLEEVQGPAGASAVAPGLDESLGIVNRVLQQVRNLSLDLRPAILDDLGLVAALRWYLDRHAQRADFVASFSADPAEIQVPADIATTCFRVAQEALTNVARHARAASVQVEVRQRPESLELAVRDDGVGFDEEAAARVAKNFPKVRVIVLSMHAHAVVKRHDSHLHAPAFHSSRFMLAIRARLGGEDKAFHGVEAKLVVEQINGRMPLQLWMWGHQELREIFAAYRITDEVNKFPDPVQFGCGLGIGQGLPALPARYRSPGHSEQARVLFLGYAEPCAEPCDWRDGRSSNPQR